jgi:hypothetical protein
MPQTGREEVEEEEEEEAGERREREEARRAKLLSQLHVLLGTPRPPLLLLLPLLLRKTPSEREEGTAERPLPPLLPHEAPVFLFCFYGRKGRGSTKRARREVSFDQKANIAIRSFSHSQ